MNHWHKLSAIRPKLQAVLPMFRARLEASPLLRPGHLRVCRRRRPTTPPSNAGAIVGGVVGVALIAGLVAWLTIRRRRRRAPSAEYISGQGSDIGASAVSYPMDIVRPKLYVGLFFSRLREGLRDHD